MRNFTVVVFLFFALISGSLFRSSIATTRVDRDWVMHIYVGGHLYEDRLHLEQAPGAGDQWKGTVTVPGLFTATLRNIAYTKDALSFDIEADEGHGPFHVKYVANFYPGTDTFSGFATLTDDNTLLGGFVGQRN